MLNSTLFDVESIRKDFPILERKVNGHPLIYLDNAATSQTPKVVIDAIVDYATGTWTLSGEGTITY